MNKALYKAFLKDFGPTIFRNLFSIVAVIIGGLSVALIILGDKRDGLFLGSVITINVIIGIVQELRAKLSLEKLQLLTKSKYQVIRKGTLLNVFTEEIEPGDIVELKLGEQVPVDGKIISSEGLECNLALLTGESANITMQINSEILSGSIVVAGQAKVKATRTDKDSYLYKMNVDLKKYQTSYSPIQKAIIKFIKIMSAILLILGVIIISRTFIMGDSLLSGFVQIAALASTIIAEGLLLASTLLFAYGAIKMAKQKVLLQQINAIENFGRMSIVCIDKTGTLTENNPVYEKYVAIEDTIKPHLEKVLATYCANETSRTTTFDAIKSRFDSKSNYKTKEILAFSSERKYSALRVAEENKVLIIGAADKFINKLNPTQKVWAEAEIKKYSMQAKRIIFVAEAQMSDLKSINTIRSIKAIGILILSNPIKKGSVKTIDALQARGVQIIIISGDNAQTVAAIAEQSKINYGGRVITGDKLEELNINEIQELISQRTIFARTLPNQKQKIIEAIKLGNKNVAMIGDGANDAMAIKTADIGIAMFDGAPATRQIADAVLINNSFEAIPKGIKLSDTIITTLEMIGSLFFTRVWSGVFLLLITLLLKIEYPLQPRNITLINIFIITLPIILWLSYPRHRKRSIKDPSYLSRTLPFSIANALIIALACLTSIFLLNYFGVKNEVPMTVFLVFFIMSIYSVGLIPSAIGTEENKTQQRLIYIGYVFAAIILTIFYFIPVLANFFDLGIINLKTLIIAISIAYLGAAIQYLFVKFKIANKLWLKFKDI